MRKTLDIIIPVFNEEDCITKTLERLFTLRENLFEHLDINLIFVDDGSRDKTLEIIKNAAQKHSYVKVISFSRNFGHQFALTAGLEISKSDFVAIIDADLQDPPELIRDMWEKSKEGYDIVYGKRLKRKKETLFKKFTASAFYRIFDSLCQIKVPTDTGDFRFMTHEVVKAINNMPEKHRFIRAMVPWVGFKSAPLYYNRDERFAGVTKYPLSKMIKLATDGILSFSTKPIKLIHIFALGMFIISLLSYGTAAITKNILFLLIGLIIFIGAIQTLSIGIIGEYIGRIFEETKNRPLYIIKEKINF